ncbi:MAG TPA: hypothetical protein VMU51_27070, partial [Mycobacteriales bacterium]|nr:hypothetical protein [Mycobacteriales bacterium]
MQATLTTVGSGCGSGGGAVVAGDVLRVGTGVGAPTGVAAGAGGGAVVARGLGWDPAGGAAAGGGDAAEAEEE